MAILEINCPIKSMELNDQYWNNRYLQMDTGWDLKAVSPPLKRYFDQPSQPLGRVFIPGCGQAHEAEYLLELGVKQVVLLDFAPALVQQLRQKFGDTAVDVQEGDIFEHSGTYDTIVEQTLFCAIDPVRRMEYVMKMADLLHTNGVWIGLLFNRHFDKVGPPFGGTKAEYENLMKNHFHILYMKESADSVQPRLGTELFFIAKKK
jgi:methyl halide transferase